MNTYLKKWSTLINEKLCRQQMPLDELSEEKIDAIIQEFDEDVEDFRNLLMDYHVKNTSITDNQQFVRVNQRMLVRLLDKLYFYRSDMPGRILTLYKDI